ncbi:MAG: glycosyltransferase family 2 protein [Candidatus Korobacteraceae bacterium]|jgi:glycosyltransferase involved in cell wall biosynthesis
MEAKAEETEERANRSAVSPWAIPHICVCICTYKRPRMLRRLLDEVNLQQTDNKFTVSAVVVDNDAAESARLVVEEFTRQSPLRVEYYVEPQQGIARARNKVVAHAGGDYLAFIDDDEFPAPTWLFKLHEACGTYSADGILGPVKRHFEEEPPAWLRKSSLLERRVNPTGTPVDWHEARTGNVLIRGDLVRGDSQPFRPEFRSGEDQDFFRRKMAEGRRFFWSAEAVVFEVVPRERWRRSYFLRRALLRGTSAVQKPDCGPLSIAKSMVAVPVYLLALPFAQLAGHHRFMTLLVKLCDHLGKLLALVGIHPIRERYVSE